MTDENICSNYTTDRRGLSIHSDALTGLAMLEAQEGCPARAYELVAHVLRHPASSRDTGDRARRLCGEIQARLSQEQMACITARAGAETLNEVVSRLQTG